MTAAPASAITIRALAATDAVAWERLFRGYIAFYEADVPDAVIAQTFAKLLSGEPGAHRGLVAVDASGALLGLAHILFHRSTWSPTGYLYLEDLFVDPNARTKGIGRALISAVYHEADRLGATRTYWTTQETNDRARSLYDTVATKSPFVQYRR